MSNKQRFVNMPLVGASQVGKTTMSSAYQLLSTEKYRSEVIPEKQIDGKTIIPSMNLLAFDDPSVEGLPGITKEGFETIYRILSPTGQKDYLQHFETALNMLFTGKRDETTKTPEIHAVPVFLVDPKRGSAGVDEGMEFLKMTYENMKKKGKTLHPSMVYATKEDISSESAVGEVLGYTEKKLNEMYTDLGLSSEEVSDFAERTQYFVGAPKMVLDAGDHERQQLGHDHQMYDLLDAIGREAFGEA